MLVLEGLAPGVWLNSLPEQCVVLMKYHIIQLLLCTCTHVPRGK